MMSINLILNLRLRKCALRFVCLCFFSCICSLSIQAQGLVNPASIQMSPQQFDAWVLQQTSKTQKSVVEPQELSSALLERLKQGLFVSDDIVISIVISSINSENQQFRDKITSTEEKASRYKDSLLLISKVGDLLYKREFLQARLYQEAASLYSLERKVSEEQKELEKANQLLEGFSISVDKSRVKTAVDLAVIYARANEGKKAEKLYQEATSYPWWNLDAENLYFFKREYVRAGRGFIDLKRGNLKYLERLWFAPSAPDLVSYLQEAIQQAREQKTKDEALLNKGKGATQLNPQP